MKAEEQPEGELDGQPGWRRTLYATGIAELVAMMGFSFVMPFIPFYIRAELGVTDDRMVAIWAGILVTGPSLVFVFFAPFWGMIADRYGRKPMVERAMFGGAVLLVLMGRAKNVYQLLALRLLQGVVTGTVAASNALVSSVTPLAMLGYSMGLMQTAIFAGSPVGAWVGGMTADHFGYRTTFYIAAGLIFVSGCAVLWGVKERFSRPTSEMVRANGTLRDVAKNYGFSTMLAVFFLVNFAGSIGAPIFPLFVEKLVVVKAKVASTTGLIIGISGLVAGITAGIVGRISDRVGHKIILTLCTLFSGIFCIPLALAQSVGQLLGIRALFGLAAGGTGPTVNAIIGKIAPRNSHGKAYGLTTAVSSLGRAVGPLIGGFAASWLGLRIPFVIMGLMLILISAVVALRVKEA